MKFADENNAFSERGGRPSLTKSAKLRECNFSLARLATSSSAMVVELGGWDHLCAEGEGWRA